MKQATLLLVNGCSVDLMPQRLHLHNQGGLAQLQLSYRMYARNVIVRS